MLPFSVSLAKSPLRLRLDREEAKKAGRFVALFVFLYLFLSLVVFAVIPEGHIQGFIANATAAFFGGTVSWGENPIVALSNGVEIEISPICTGMTELFIIAAAILASLGIEVWKRLVGAVLAAASVFALNLFRVVATTAAMLGDSLTAAELLHNVFFRAFLFVSVAALYVVWFYWAVKK
jgi:exosortase/archaeosortase family protein